MPAVSKAQQKFFGIVRAIQKGEMAPTTPETAKAAASMKKKDVKDFASTKHKGLPMKKEVEEAYYGGEEQRKKDEQKAKYEKQLKKMLPKRAFDSMGRELDPRSGKLKEEDSYSQKDKIMKKAKPLHKHLFKSFNKGDREGDVNESRYDRYDDEKREFEKSDSRMKYGKNWNQYVKDAQSAKNKLRPGEVKKFNKETGKWESNKD